MFLDKRKKILGLATIICLIIFTSFIFEKGIVNSSYEENSALQQVNNFRADDESKEKIKLYSDKSQNWTFLGFEEKMVNSLAITEDYLYVSICSTDFKGVKSLGVFKKNLKSQDSKWKYVGFMTNKVESIHVANDSKNTIYIGISDGTGFGLTRVRPLYSRLRPHSLFKSSDDGNTWTPCDNGFRRLFFRREVFDISTSTKNPNNICVFTYNKVFNSNNGGKNWDPIWNKENYNFYQYNIVAIDPTDDNIIFVGGESLGLSAFLDKSIDGGDSWIHLYLPNASNNAVNSIAIHPRDSNTVYIGMEGHVVKTIDGGESWNAILSPEEYPYFEALKLDPLNPEHIFAGFGPQAGCINEKLLIIWESHDGGETWISHGVSSEDGGRNVLCFEIYTENDKNILFVGTVGGLWKYEY